MSDPAIAVRIAGRSVSRRALALFAAAAMTLGGVAFTYAIPAALALDVRFATAEECTVGLLIGLTLAFLGNAALTALATPHGKASPRMTSTPTPQDASSPQSVITGRGYFSTTPDMRDDLSVIFTYRPAHPYSVLMDIGVSDPSGYRAPDSALWEVARETIYDVVMLGKPTSGVGDFTVSSLSARRVLLRVVGTDALGRNADYCYDMHLSRMKLRAFLLRTMAAVPIGHETGHLDMDRQLQELLS